MVDEQILTLISKEKFRRKMLVSSRVIAIFLILAILYIGWVQYNYAYKITLIKEKYGSLGYCYMCGLETYRVCGCQYSPDVFKTMSDINYTQIAQFTANNNVLPCPVKYVEVSWDKDTLTNLTFKN